MGGTRFRRWAWRVLPLGSFCVFAVADEIAGRVMGAIISLHDGDDSTVAALAQILDDLGERYRFVAVSQLRSSE